jgi:hypothetical protein
MSDKELLKLLGLEDRTISIGLDDEYARIVLEKRIDDYLKKLDEEKKKQEQIEFLKGSHSEFKEKEKLLEMLLSKHVMNKLVDRLIREGFSYKCPTCLDVSSQYGRPIQCYPKYNKNK